VKVKVGAVYLVQAYGKPHLFLVLALDGGEWSAAYARDSLDFVEMRKGLPYLECKHSFSVLQLVAQ